VSNLFRAQQNTMPNHWKLQKGWFWWNCSDSALK